MNGIPEYGTGRHEDYLSQQDERAEVARDLQAEEDHAEWLGWMDAQGYAESQRKGFEGYGGGDMLDTFKAGMQAARDLAAAQPQDATPPGHVAVMRGVIALREAEIELLRKQLDAALKPAPASPCSYWSDPSDDFYGVCVKDAYHEREGDPEHENEHGIRWTGKRWEGAAQPKPAPREKGSPTS